MSRAETRLGPVDQVPVGEGRTFRVGDEQIAVFRTRAGGLHALGAACPHLGGPLADGLVDADVVVCPLHHHRFALAGGSCDSGADDVAAYAVRDDDGELVVAVDAG